MADFHEADMNEEKKHLKEGNGEAIPLENNSTDNALISNGPYPKAVEAEVDFAGKTKVYEEFTGLNKEELMKFATDPKWVRIRLVLLVVFVLAWIAMLAAAIAIIVVSPKCPPRPNLAWWQTSVVYQLNPLSFQDTSGDGVGDLQGIQQRVVSYLKTVLNVTAVSLGSVYTSPDADFGYDIKNYKSICHKFGTMAEFDSLVTTMHKNGMKLIMDFVPNHTSRKHEWFNQSRQGIEPYQNFYVWHTGTTVNGNKQPPNNWLSVYGGSAWQYDDVRGAYYLHQFSEHQPDLNLTNPLVKTELADVLKFWLARGVAGFRVKDAQYLVETDDLTQNEPISSETGLPEGDYHRLLHPLTTFQPQSYALVAEWRTLLDEYSADDGKSKSQFYPRVLIVDVDGSANQTARFVNTVNGSGAHLATNLALTRLRDRCGATCVRDLVHQWLDVARTSDPPIWMNWQLGNMGVSRIASRMSNAAYVKAANMLLLTLPGTPLTYYGEELGMHDVDVAFNETKDPAGMKWKEALYKKYSRDPHRTPMQWTDGPTAGFTTGARPWLPISSDHAEINVEAQTAHGSGISNINVFSELAVLRKEPSFQWGEFHDTVEDNVYFYVRKAQGFPGFLVAINFGPVASTVDLRSSHTELAKQEAEIVASTYNFAGPGRSDDYTSGVMVKLASVFLKPAEGIIVRWEAETMAG